MLLDLSKYNLCRQNIKQMFYFTVKPNDLCLMRSEHFVVVFLLLCVKKKYNN